MEGDSKYQANPKSLLPEKDDRLENRQQFQNVKSPRQNIGGTPLALRPAEIQVEMSFGNQCPTRASDFKGTGSAASITSSVFRIRRTQDDA